MVTFDSILQRMKEKGKTQRELAEFLGITEHKVSHWKNNRSDSYVKYIEQISEFLGVSIEEIYGEETKNPAIENDDGNAKLLYDKLLDAGIDIKKLSSKEIEKIIALVKAGFDV